MEQHQLQAEDDGISLIDVLLFLKASVGNIVKSTLVCVLAGSAYYFSIPKMYEASATFEMATVAGKPVESPVVLLEKMKLSLYFSPATLQACGLGYDPNSRANLVDKIKPTVNKSAPMVSFVTQALSTQEAKACLNSAIADVSNNQEAIAKPLILQKKQKLQQLSERVKFIEEIGKTSNLPKGLNNETYAQFFALNSFLSTIVANATEISALRLQINALEHELLTSETYPLTLLSPVYASEAPTNKRPAFILVFFLALGFFLGLLVTGLLRVGKRLTLVTH
jgi:hypothetical protein